MNKNNLSIKTIGAILTLIFFGNIVVGQKLVNTESYWPPLAPNNVSRTSADETAEDWWFDIKTVPSTHPAFSSGKFIACGYSGYDEVGLQNVATNDPCYAYIGNDLSLPDAAGIADEFELSDMKHLNNGASIGLINITPTHSASENPYSWVYTYGLGSAFGKVIPTADGGFLAVGFCEAFKTTGPIAASPNDPYLPDVRYQAPSSLPATPNQFGFLTGCNIPDNPNEWNDPNNPAARHRHAALLKVDRFGKILWYYKYGIVPFTGSGNEAYFNGSYGTDVAEVSDGYIMIGGLSNFPVNGNYGGAGFIAKVDFVGNLVWIKQFKENTPFVTNRFTSIKTKNVNGIVYAFVSGERTKTKMFDTPAGQSSPAYSSAPLGSLYWNGTYDPSYTQYKAIIVEPFLRKINLSTQTEVWQIGGSSLSGDLTLNHRCRNVAIDLAGNILLSVSSSCFLSFANGECINNVVHKITDNGASATVTQTTNFGALRAYDLERGLSISATTDGGYEVVGTKKNYTLNLEQNYSVAPFGNGYNMLNSGNTDRYAQTDAFVAKCNASGVIEWNTIFDNSGVSPGGNYLATAGNPINQANINSWMNFTSTRSKKDIKRQECVYAIANSTSPEGNIIIAGNNSANIDDSYVAMVQNTCQLDLSNHLVQSMPVLPGYVSPVSNITMMSNFIAPVISTGRKPGNTDQVAKFTVNNKGQTVLEAGQVVDLYEGTDLGFVNTTETPSAVAEADVDVKINAAHTCTAGAVLQYNVPAGTTNGTAGRPQSLAVENTISTESISIYPNPVSNSFTLNISLMQTGSVSVEILDLHGASVKRFIIPYTITGKKLLKSINVSELPASVYICKISAGNISKKVKLVKEQ